MNTALSINPGQYSDAGIKSQNEDACGIRIPEGTQLTNKGIAISIADGVSSSALGREAAESCVTGFLNDYFSTPDSWTVRTSGTKIITAINNWLYGRGQSQATAQGMLSTFSALILKSTTAHIFHVGDSRIYRLRNGELEQLTRDHKTWCGTEKSFLSRAMGADILVEIDYRSEALETGDIFLLSTDGVHDFLSEQQIKHAFKQHQDSPERAAYSLVKQALQAGSHDNATCQIIHIEQLPTQSEDEFYQHLVELPFPPALENGMKLDGFEILRELHASSRSQVYLARDMQTQQQVAIKTPSVNFEDDANYIDGFRLEQWAGKRINSPHVLKIIKPRQSPRMLYYVTEYIEGQTLRQWMNDNPHPSLEQVRSLINQLCSGIRAFHRLEMLHQDIKPENIMIDHNDLLKIIDFGSTRIAGIQEINTPIDRGQLLGTVDYAAPEYFANQPASNVSDIYSIAVITYQMLTGQLPYGKPLSQASLKRVSYQPARELNPQVPQWMDAALEKACRINPQRRQQLLSEFLHDLSQPNPQLQQEHFQPLLERNPLAFWRSLAIVLLISQCISLYFIFV